MADNFVQLKKDDLLRIKIKDSDGNYTGEELVFDLEDVELPLIYQDVIEQTKKNKEHLQNQFVMIEKRQDVKGKKVLSKNQEDKIKALKEFYERQVEIYNMILGENGVSKLLGGRKVGWTSLADIDEIIGTQLQPYIDVDMNRIKDKIRERIGKVEKEDKEVLK